MYRVGLKKKPRGAVLENSLLVPVTSARNTMLSSVNVSLDHFPRSPEMRCAVSIHLYKSPVS